MNNYKQNLIHRLKIIRGHMDKVIEMVEKDKYCIDVLQQSAAVGSALRKADQIILENHLRHCVSGAMTSQKDVDGKVEEIIKVFQKR